ncbi:MAG TPA: thymidine phosphorylase [Thermoanaerobaculia bacterium]|nr:thymidine phosphorylase [Thermoanaerobaculia bacterium]
MILPYRILERKRAGLPLDREAIGEVVRGAAAGADSSWSDAQLAAFLMAAAIRGLDPGETEALTLAMLESGERWHLGSEVPHLADKHSTGGVGDKISLTLGPLLASCGVPIVMLVGRALGHTGGTADKLESIPGIGLELDRERCLDLLSRSGLAIGVATAGIAPADRKLYALRDATATIDSLPLITGSILSKKLATGAAGLVFDVKTGNGAFLPALDDARELARMLVGTARALGTAASALITDMSQPLGRWVGHAAEVREALACLAGEGPEDIAELTLALAEEAARLAGTPLSRAELEEALVSGQARRRFFEWAALSGAEPGWLDAPFLPLAPVERPILAPRSGRLARVDTRQLGLLLIEAGAGRARPGATIDHGVSLCYFARLGREVAAGEELARLYLRREDPELAARFADCFMIADEAASPPLVHERVG